MNNELYENYVSQIVREGSLTKAAAQIGISQPALSSGISSLEKKLGFRIFNRSLSPVTLTPEGQIYFDYINRKKALSMDFQTRIEACTGARDNHVSVGAPVVYSESIVSLAVNRLLMDHPEDSVSLRTASLGQLIEQTANGELDCFISTSDDLPAEFILKEIKREQIYLCIPEKREINDQLGAYRDGKQPFSIFSLLADEEFILLEKNQPIQVLIDSFLEQQNIRLKSRVTVNQVSTAVNLASMGLGCCFASEDALFQLAGRIQLKIYSLPDDVSVRHIYAVRHREFYQSRACRDLIELLVNGQ